MLSESMKFPGIHSKNSFTRHFTGSVLILLGLIGIVLPIAPGIIFIVLGLEAFGLRHILTAYLEKLDSPISGFPRKNQRKKT